MKKLIVSLLASCFLFSVVLVSGCSKKEKDEKKTATTPTEKEKPAPTEKKKE